MKKQLLLITLLVFGFNLGYSQDSTDVPKKEPMFKVDYDVNVASQNVWRGLRYGDGLMIAADMWLESKYWDLGLMGTTSLIGVNKPFVNWMEIYTTFKLHDFTLTFDDYFFFDPANPDYFNWDHRTTQHFVETRLGYSYKEYFSTSVGFVIYSNASDNTQDGIYLEATGQPWDFLSFTVGGVTAASNLSFYNAGGVTHISVNGHKDIKINKNLTVPLQASFIVNPNWRNGMTDVSRSPVYFTVMFTI